jgi:hypothetical protein
MVSPPRATGRGKFAEPDIFRMCNTACIYRMPRPDGYSVVIRLLGKGHEARIAGKPPIDWAGQAFSAVCAFLFIRDADHSAG